MPKDGIRIKERDLNGDCTLLNRKFDLIQSQIDTLGSGATTNNTYVIGGGSVTSGNCKITETAMAISAPTTINPPIAATGVEILVYFLTQDATGHAVTWGSIGGSTFKHPPVVPTTANMVSVVMFIGKADGNWWLISSLLGVHS